ncbi:hypothetical protein GCM10010331_50980 [Streptomyces xanthochromogenes]|nr:hypothetical protein GCM10010331_50980 [Streptomyces xanthochromogenes]
MARVSGTGVVSCAPRLSRAASGTAGVGTVIASGRAGGVAGSAGRGVPGTNTGVPVGGVGASGAMLRRAVSGDGAAAGGAEAGAEAGGVAAGGVVSAAGGEAGAAGAVQRRNAPQESQNDCPVARAGVPQSGQGTMAGVDM